MGFGLDVMLVCVCVSVLCVCWSQVEELGMSFFGQALPFRFREPGLGTGLGGAGIRMHSCLFVNVSGKITIFTKFRLGFFSKTAVPVCLFLVSVWIYSCDK